MTGMFVAVATTGQGGNRAESVLILKSLRTLRSRDQLLDLTSGRSARR